MSRELRIGALYLMLGEALLAIMGALIKHLSDDLSTEQVVFFRNILGLIVLAPLIMNSGIGSLKTSVWHWHLMRGLVGVAAMYCYFWALGNMPLTEAFLVKLSSPFFMPLLAWWWLKEPTGKFSGLALLIGFSGVAIILRPGTDSTFTLAALIGLLGAALAALAKVTIRRMSVTESSQCIVFYFGLIASLVSFPAALMNWRPVPDDAWWWLAAMGLVATVGQLALTKAYRTAPTGKVGVYVYSAVIYGALMGWWFWDEIPGWTTIAGAVLIILAGIVNLWQPRSRGTPDATTATATSATTATDNSR
ncbi:DMT family transporter [Oceanobacter sp. 5_MG-2023]|uniref:DMT family transporter n=1 Tax=Oceanobacter sp. 5_MG-2023 TaxID=3062645 RepID=UPI0026E3372B|nr:DMT family transporter [Oceanobacter sp. 5_MG-2023]MDO6682793.1 DMT family transporter [Oceanobacter sp. 5_MG-2023]